MKRSRYNLTMKVQGNTGEYVIRRRVVDGAFECNCPRYNQQRKECHHVREAKDALLPSALLTPNPFLDIIEHTVKSFPFFINDEARLVRELQGAFNSYLRSFDE